MRALFIALLSLCFLSFVNAQNVGISDMALTPDTTAMLDVQSTTKGFLTPRMTSNQRENIAGPANGLLVYDTDFNSYWFYRDGNWTSLMSSILPPVDPEPADSLALISHTRFSVLNGNFLYVSQNSAPQLNVVDVSNPENIFVTGTLNLPGATINGLAVDGDLLYASFSSSDHVKTYNVADPQNIVEVNSWNIDDPSNLKQYVGKLGLRDNVNGHIEVYDKVSGSLLKYYDYGAVIFDDYHLEHLLLYVLVHTGAGIGELRIIDLSGPGMSGVLISTTTVGTFPEKIVIENGLAFISHFGSNDLKIYDVGDINAPSFLSSKTIGNDPTNVIVQGNYCYVLEETIDSIIILDISEPLTPHIVSAVKTGEDWFDALHISSNYLIHQGEEIRMFQLSKPAVATMDVNGGISPRQYIDWENNDYGASYKTGNIGIGTEATQAPLSMKGNGGTTIIGITQNQVGGSSTMELTTADGSGDQATRLLIRGGSDEADIELYSGASGSETKVLHVEGTNGFVGIGDIIPLHELDVRGNQLVKTTRPHIHLATTNPAGDGITLQFDENESAFKIQKRTNNGSTYQDNLLTVDINGGMWVPDLPMGDYNNMQYDDSSGRFYHDTSSRRFKENITTLGANFSQILNLVPKTYTRPGNPNRWEIGYIAEEADELGLKELVSYDEQGRPANVNYRKMTLYLNEVNKAQEEKINSLEERLEKLEDLLLAKSK